jgi:signal transduction histidine kinase
MGMRDQSQISELGLDALEWERPLPVDDILDILRLILRIEPLDVLMQKTVDTISESFGMKRVSLGVMDDKTGRFSPRAVHGFPPEKVAAIKSQVYTLERIKNELRQELRIGRNCYFVRAEDRRIQYSDDPDYIMDSELAELPRASPSDWHELDYIDFVMTDRLGNWIGWIEIDEPSSHKIPSKDVLDRIQVLADLAAIAVENSKVYEDAVSAMNDSKAYLDLIVHDIGNMVAPLQCYLNWLNEAKDLDDRTRDYARNAATCATAMGNLVENVRKLSELQASEPRPKRLFDLNKVLPQCEEDVKREFPTKKVVVSHDFPSESCIVVADDLIHDLFKNLLSNAVKYTPGSDVQVKLGVRESQSAYTIVVEDHGRGIPDSRKDQIFRRFAKRPDGFGGTGLGMSIVALLSERYEGIVAVKDRVPGNCSMGTCFEVSLPKAETSTLAEYR